MKIERTLFEPIDRLRAALDCLREHEPPEGYYLAFSGGKDSIVLYDLARLAGVRFDAHFHLTTVDPPELLRFVRENYPDVERTRPRVSMFRLIIEKRMPPTRMIRYCCEELKERGGKGRLILTGLRWAESGARRRRQQREQCLRDKSKSFLHPIIEWSDDDVWSYIHARGLSYCSLYDEGFKRIGCIGCPMSRRARAVEFERWPRFRRLYLRAFDRCVESRKADGFEAPKGVREWSSGEEMMAWWMDEDNRGKASDAQQVLFD